MRLLLLTENYPPSLGGMSQSCDRLVNSLRSNNIDVDVLHFSNRNKPFTQVEKINGRYVALPKHNDIAHGLNLALTYIEHHLDSQAYDDMLIFGGNLPVTAAPVFSQLLSLDYYLCLRGNDFDISLFDAKRRGLLDNAVGHSKGVFVGSYNKVKRLNKLYPAVPTYYSPSGIDLENWQAFDSENSFATQWREKNIREGQVVIGLFGFLKAKKGVRFFLDALIKSKQLGDVHLLLSGEQPDEISEMLEEHQISHTKIPHTDRYELIKHFLTCDWTAIPSYYEGMPNTMLESGGLGVPVIACAVDGMRDLIDHKINGLLFRPLDVNDCIKQITTIVSMPNKQRVTLGNALKQKIEHEYTPQKEVDCYLKVLAETASTKPLEAACK